MTYIFVSSICKNPEGKGVKEAWVLFSMPSSAKTFEKDFNTYLQIIFTNPEIEKGGSKESIKKEA